MKYLSDLGEEETRIPEDHGEGGRRDADGRMEHRRTHVAQRHAETREIWEEKSKKLKCNN